MLSAPSCFCLYSSFLPNPQEQRLATLSDKGSCIWTLFQVLCHLVQVLYIISLPPACFWNPKSNIVLSKVVCKGAWREGLLLQEPKSSGLANLVSQFGEFGYPLYRDKRATFSEAPSTERIKEVLVFCKSLQPQQATGSTVWIWTSMWRYKIRWGSSVG